MTRTSSVRRVVVGGAVAQRPNHGGHAWVFANLLVGLRRLGCEVTFVDRLATAGAAAQATTAATWLETFTRWAGLDDEWALLLPNGGTVGLDRSALSARIAQADLVIDVMGYIGREAFAACNGPVAFLDIDPGWPQMWRELELADILSGYEAFVTIGENIGRPDCLVPTAGRAWTTTKQPVVLDAWPATAHDNGRFTSVASWRGPFGPIEYRGRSYGLRVHEFRKFFELPHRVAADFEVALDIHAADERDIAALHSHGWRRTDPVAAAGTPQAYQDYIQGSFAEFTVAKNLYVATRGGWFSDRSACYLASGKPVLAQDTGLEGLLPTGEGLVTFTTLDDAVAGAEDILAHPVRHAKAARAIVEEHFDSAKVLRRLLAELGVM